MTSRLGSVQLPLLLLLILLLQVSFIDGNKHRFQPDGFIYKVSTHASLEELEREAPDEFIDEVIDMITGQQTGEIIRPYKPQGSWLLRQWSGTVLQHGFQKTILIMIFSFVVRELVIEASKRDGILNKILAVENLKLFDKIWHYQLTLTTFILTFFLTNAYNLWKSIYVTGRSMQGGLSDIGYLLATHAKRDKQGKYYTREAQDFLEESASYLRLFHILVWGANSRRFRVLLTNRGLAHLVERGVVPANQVETLLSLGIPPMSRHFACLQWITVRIKKAQADGVLVGTGEGFNEVILTKLCGLKGSAGGLGSLVAGRMPLPYAHFVEFLVDTFLIGAPLALYDELGEMAFLGVGLLALFYGGLLDLAKVFLDPLENEDYCDGVIDMDFGEMIRQSNKGPVGWMNAAETLPF